MPRSIHILQSVPLRGVANFLRILVGGSEMNKAVSAAATICNSSVNDMPKELVNHLYENGAFMVFLGVDEQTEFGIDYKSWHTGGKFKGLKMIPPGVHFIYFSVKTAPRIGFFHHFKEREVLVRKWDASLEDMSTEEFSHDQIEAIRADLKNMDSNLAPYPYETFRSWYALSSYITEHSISRLRPENRNGRITGQAELVTMETELMEEECPMDHPSSQVDRDHPTRLRFVDESGLPIMRIRPGFEIRFTELSLRRDIVDCSQQLDKFVENLDDNWSEVLGELQFAFVCFLLGQVYEGFEQWKRVMYLLCSSKEAIEKYKDMYLLLLPLIHFQLKECPRDFFVDIVTKDNFLTTTLSKLFQNINDCQNADSTLKQKSSKFKQFLTKKFKWNFDQV